MTTALTIPRRELRPGIKRYADSDSTPAWDVYLDDRLVASEYVALADARMELDFALWYALFAETSLNAGTLITDEALGLALQVFKRLFSAEKIQEKALTAREKIIASGIYSIQSDGSLSVLASSSRGKQSSYTVTSTCTCKDYFTRAHLRGGVCKHIAARMLLILAQYGVGYLKHLRDALDATPVLIHGITPTASAPIVPETADDAQHAPQSDAPGLAFLNIGAADLAAALFLAQRVGTPLTLDTRTHRVARDGRPIELTAKEYAILECLLRAPGHVLTRTLIADQVWNYEVYNQSNVVDVYIRNLRRKIDDPCMVKLIHTVRGAGYRLAVEVEAADETL